jgi:hypothetical protein
MAPRQTIGDVAESLAGQPDRLLAQIAIERDRGLHRAWVGSFTAADFDERDQMHGIERMAEHAAFGPGA